MEKPMEISKPITYRINEARIIELLRSRGPLSRADIARHTKLTKATISRIISDLEERNLIREVGFGSLKRGRKPVLYEFDTGSQVVVGMEVKHDSCLAIVTNLEATPITRLHYPLPDTEVHTFIEVFEKIFLRAQKEFPGQIIGVGIGIPGIFDYEEDRVILAENIGWANVELAKMIRQRVNTNVYVVNRANAAALGEKWYGAGKAYSDLIYIGIGSGIGAGIVLSGELYWGANGSAGEIGHMTIAPGGPLCRCGKRGCLEAIASTIAIQERVKTLVKVTNNTSILSIIGHSLDELSPADVVKAANAGDELAIEVLKGIGESIGIGVANMINVFNPQRVIIGGFATDAPPLFLEAIKLSAKSHAFSIPWQAADIVKSELGNDAVAIGAAALLLSKYFDPQVASFGLWDGVAAREAPLMDVDSHLGTER
jgi:N-acetylglucosamine repressor